MDGWMGGWVVGGWVMVGWLVGSLVGWSESMDELDSLINTKHI